MAAHGPNVAAPATEDVADFIAAVLDRSAAYRWPPAARALARGHAVRPTRRGWAVFYQWRKENRPPIDLRAVEVEAARAAGIFASPTPPPEQQAPAEGLTIEEFAAWAGVDRRRISEHLEVIPPGPVPPLPVGKIPARQVGNTLRLFPRDFRGDPEQRAEGERDVRDSSHQEATPGPAGGTAWDRQIAGLRDRGGQR